MTPRKVNIVSHDGCVCRNPDCSIPYGTCHCGCGRITSIAPQSISAKNRIKGEPLLFLLGHGAIIRRPILAQPTDSQVRLIALTQGKVTEVDEKNFSRLSLHLWYAWKNPKNGEFYAARNRRTGSPRGRIYMHEEILPVPDGYMVDHIDRNTLRNLESNLRPATNAENMRNHNLFSSNTSGYTGISWSAAAKKWRAAICFNGKSIHLGVFTEIDKAVAARRTKEIELFGEFSPLVDQSR